MNIDKSKDKKVTNAFSGDIGTNEQPKPIQKETVKQLKLNFENGSIEEAGIEDLNGNEKEQKDEQVKQLKNDEEYENELFQQMQLDIPVSEEEPKKVSKEKLSQEKGICKKCLSEIPINSSFCPCCGQKDPVNTTIMKDVLVVRHDRIRKAEERYILLEKDNQRNGVLLIDGYYKGKDFNFIFLDEASKYRCGVYQRQTNKIIKLTPATAYYLQCYYECNKVENGKYEYIKLKDLDDNLFVDIQDSESKKKTFTEKLKQHVGLNFETPKNKDIKDTNISNQKADNKESLNKNEDIKTIDEESQEKEQIEQQEDKITEESNFEKTNIEPQNNEENTIKADGSKNISKEIETSDEIEENDLEGSSKLDESNAEEKTENFKETNEENKRKEIDNYEPIPKHFRHEDEEKNAEAEKNKNTMDALLIIIGALLVVILIFGVMCKFSLFPSSKDANSVSYPKTSQVAKESTEELTTVIADAQKKTVSVSVYLFNQNVGSGSGVVYKTDKNTAYIVTNAHVASAGTDYKITFSDNEEVTAELVNYNSEQDISVLKCNTKDLKFDIEPFEMGDSSVLKAGETAIAIGSPLSVSNAGTVTRGIISAVNRTLTVDTNNDGIADTKRNAIQTDAAINPGNSGGALINSYGQLIGITNMKLASSEIEGIGYAIPVNDVVTIADAIINTKGATSLGNV